MLMVVQMAAFLASHSALQAAILEISGGLSDVAILILVGSYAATLLALTSFYGYLFASWRRIMISVAYGGVYGAFFSCAAIVKSELPTKLFSSPEVYGFVLIASFLLWGGGAHTAIRLAFGAPAREEYWEHIKNTYSTFRKD